MSAYLHNYPHHRLRIIVLQIWFRTQIPLASLPLLNLTYGRFANPFRGRSTNRAQPEIRRHFVTVSPRWCIEIFHWPCCRYLLFHTKANTFKPWKQRWRSPAPMVIAGYRISLSWLIGPEVMTCVHARMLHANHVWSLSLQSHFLWSAEDNMNPWIIAGKIPSNLLSPVRTSSLWGTSLIASNVTIRATSCCNVIRHQSKFNAAFEWETTAALHADSCSLMAWLEKWISLICLIAYVTCRQFGLSVQGWESANLGLNLFQKANEKAVTAFSCLFFWAKLPQSSVKARCHFTLIIPLCKHGNQSTTVWWISEGQCQK